MRNTQTSIKSLLIVSAFSFFIITHLQAEELFEGLRYRKLVTPIQQTIHVMEVDPKHLQIKAAHAKDQALGRETVATIAKRHKAIAAINGGFFKAGELIDGLPAGVLKIHGNWYGVAYQARGAIAWSSESQTVLIDRIQTKTSVYLNHHKYPVNLVNQPGKPNATVLYTSVYGSPAASVPGGYDIKIKDNHILGFEPAGKTPIPKNGYVYSIGPKSRQPRYPLEVDDAATVNIEVIPHFNKENYLAWQAADNIIGGSPVLLYNGKVAHNYSSERLRSTFTKERYARTAVGVLGNGHWIFVVVEQSAVTGSPGMTIPELATLMQDLGAEDAINLDGGGSSTFFIDNAVINHPEGDDEEDYGWTALRPVSDAILILPKKHPR